MSLPIVTGRLVIRDYVREDAADVARVHGDPLVDPRGACLAEAQERGYDRVVAFVLPGNTRSEGVARKAGMTPEGEREWFGRPHVEWAADLRATIDIPHHDRED